MSAIVADYDDSSAEIVRSRMVSAMLRKEPVRIAPDAESDRRKDPERRYIACQVSSDRMIA